MMRQRVNQKCLWPAAPARHSPAAKARAAAHPGGFILRTERPATAIPRDRVPAVSPAGPKRSGGTAAGDLTRGMSRDNGGRINQAGSIARSATLSPMLHALFVRHRLLVRQPRPPQAMATGRRDATVWLGGGSPHQLAAQSLVRTARLTYKPNRLRLY
jgi:hypothetical protein